MMAERIVPGPVCPSQDNCEAVCIHTRKIYDSCKEEDIAPYIFLSKNQTGRRVIDSSKSFWAVFLSLL